jgi:hypothetical protein
MRNFPDKLPNIIANSRSSSLQWAIGLWITATACLSAGPAFSQATGTTAESTTQATRIRISTSAQCVDVFFDERLFTSLRTEEKNKPFLFPVYGPNQVQMTRQWPMENSGLNEPVDHPHHKGVWFSHIINGIDFWTEKQGIVQLQTVEVSEPDEIKTMSHWIRKQDKSIVLSDQTCYRFGGDDQSRWIDVAITWVASHGDVVFEDTKEGTFAIRVPFTFQFDAAHIRNNPQSIGKARNNSGQTGSAIWGQPAKWVVYQGMIEQQNYSIAIFDHPENLRHPTTWHARDYGLFAANPFGLHDFQKTPPGQGEHRLTAGQSMHLRYRLLLIAGSPQDQLIENWYQLFSTGK